MVKSSRFAALGRIAEASAGVGRGLGGTLKNPLRRFRLRRLTRILVPVGVLILSLSLTLAVFLLLRVNDRARDQARFENQVLSVSDHLQRRMDAYIALLRGTSGLFAIQGEVSPEQFSEYILLLEIQSQYPGIQGIGFTRRFPREERSSIEQWGRTRGGIEDFRVWPEVPDEEWHAIVMLEPRDERNRAAMGYNMYSEPTRREAMARARDTGMPALSGMVTLKQEIGAEKQAGFLLYLPVYRHGFLPPTVEGRREALVGFVYSPFRVGDLLNGIFGQSLPSTVAFQLYDGQGVAPERLMFSTHAPESWPRTPRLTTARTFEVGGHEWTLAFETLPAFEQHTLEDLVTLFLGMGVLVSLALFFLMLTQGRSREQALRGAEVLRGVLAERTRLEAQLREADRRKDDFLAMLAHELRSPLAPMLTAVQLMERKLRTGQSIHWERDVVERQVNHMRRLVDDLLDVSRVSRGKIQLQKTPVELVGGVKRALEAVRPFAESRRHTLSAELPAEPVWTMADPVRLEQVLTNLLNNAAKYTEPGGHISLKLGCEAGEAVVRVVDTGMGIPAEALPHLFEPFMQVEHTLDRAQGGLGLGLALVKRLVELHGGRVEAASAGVGQGSTFTVHLPLLPRELVPKPSETSRLLEEAPAASRRVLVVDDNVDAAELLGAVLELDGHQVMVVHDGLTALDRMDTFAPQVVFLDISLPGLDGYEVARRIRRRPGGAGVRLVAVTGFGQASDRRRSREAGFDAHLVKPVEFAMVRALVAGGEAQPPQPPSLLSH